VSAWLLQQCYMCIGLIVIRRVSAIGSQHSWSQLKPLIADMSAAGRLNVAAVLVCALV
jgi:hypothetical protein